MKRITKKLLPFCLVFGIVTALFLSSCQKETPTPPTLVTENASVGYIDVTIDGTNHDSLLNTSATFLSYSKSSADIILLGVRSDSDDTTAYCSTIKFESVGVIKVDGVNELLPFSLDSLVAINHIVYMVESSQLKTIITHYPSFKNDDLTGRAEGTFIDDAKKSHSIKIKFNLKSEYYE